MIKHSEPNLVVCYNHEFVITMIVITMIVISKFDCKCIHSFLLIFGFLLIFIFKILIITFLQFFILQTNKFKQKWVVEMQDKTKVQAKWIISFKECNICENLSVKFSEVEQTCYCEKYNCCCSCCRLREQSGWPHFEGKKIVKLPIAKKLRRL